MHIQTLWKILKRCREKNITLALDKCMFCVPELIFVGDLLTKDGLKPDPEKVKAINDMERPTGVKDIE